jgi:hypothetical protein
LVEICRFALGHDNIGEVNGERPNLVVTIRLEDLETAPAGRCCTPAAASPRRSCGGLPATRTSSQSSWVKAANPSTSGGPTGGSHYGPGVRSLLATAAAPIRDVIDHRVGAKCTM